MQTHSRIQLVYILLISYAFRVDLQIGMVPETAVI